MKTETEAYLHPSDANTDYHTATYCPEDNKLRLTIGDGSPDCRVERCTYLWLRKLKFTSTPKQDCSFVATWSIAAEDACLAMIDEHDDIGDEDTPPQERAEQRAERFAGYRDKRRGEAHGLADRYDESPATVGYQSPQKAMSTAKRRDRTGGRAVTQWGKAEYWQSRTAGVIRHSKHLSSNDVRARRLKKIKAELRKVTKNRDSCQKDFETWFRVSNQREAEFVARAHYLGVPKSHEMYSRVEWPHSHNKSLWTSLEDGDIDWKEAVVVATEVLAGRVEYWDRCVKHMELREAYEQQMLDALGYVEPPKPKRPKLPPLLNYRVPALMIENQYHRGQYIRYDQLEMTKKEWSKIYSDYKGTRLVRDAEGKQHRVRIVILGGKWSVAFLTDSKAHEMPKLDEVHVVKEGVEAK